MSLRARRHRFSCFLPSTYPSSPLNSNICQIPAKQWQGGWNLAFGKEAERLSRCSQLWGKSRLLDRSHLHPWFWSTIRWGKLARNTAVSRMCWKPCNLTQSHIFKIKNKLNFKKLEIIVPSLKNRLQRCYIHMKYNMTMKGFFTMVVLVLLWNWKPNQFRQKYYPITLAADDSICMRNSNTAECETMQSQAENSGKLFICTKGATKMHFSCWRQINCHK